jgi:hypothetical protein
MDKLNFPEYKIPVKNSENKAFLFDVIRKKWVKANPEEWVRVNCIHFLLNQKNVPISLISVEREIKIYNIKKRFDIVVYNSDGSSKILIECKAPRVKITQSSFDQIARYNLSLKSEYLMITNGINHYYCKMDFLNKKYIFIKEIPSYT